LKNQYEYQRYPHPFQGYSYPWLRSAEQGMWTPGMDEDGQEQRDLEYWQQLYPAQTRQVQREVERQVDLADYDGSVIYDEYPDRIAMARLCEAVYRALMQTDAQNEMRGYPLGMPSDSSEYPVPDIMPEEESEEAYDFGSDGIEAMQRRDGNNGRGDWKSFGDRGLPSLIEVLLYNEIHRRRRRRRGRRSWYFG